MLEAEHLKIGYEKALLEMSLRVRRGQKIGIIGALTVCHLPRTLADRVVLQGIEAEPEDQDLRRNQPQRTVDSDLDSTHCSSVAEVPAVPFTAGVGALQSGGAATLEPVHLPRPMALDLSLCRLTGVHGKLVMARDFCWKRPTIRCPVPVSIPLESPACPLESTAVLEIFWRRAQWAVGPCSSPPESRAHGDGPLSYGIEAVRSAAAQIASTILRAQGSLEAAHAAYL